jgi:hypothetical protein
MHQLTRQKPPPLSSDHAKYLSYLIGKVSEYQYWRAYWRNIATCSESRCMQKNYHAEMVAGHYSYLLLQHERILKKFLSDTCK